MSRVAIILVAAVICSGSVKTKAMFLGEQTEEVPIERLFTNLQHRLAQDTNNFELTYDLARLHSMAYSTNLISIDVITNSGPPNFILPAGNNPLRAAPPRGYIGPGVCFSREIIGYMLKLLDSVKDAKEIADLQDKQKTLGKMGFSITPILVPLVKAAALSDLVNADAAVTFDLDGSGLPRQWGWTTSNAAWLVFDRDGHGRITSARQMFGNVSLTCSGRLSRFIILKTCVCVRLARSSG